MREFELLGFGSDAGKSEGNEGGLDGAGFCAKTVTPFGDGW